MQECKEDIRIVGMEWDPNKQGGPFPQAIFALKCNRCSFEFPIEGRWRGLVECPKCQARASMRGMGKEYLIGFRDLLKKWWESDNLMPIETLSNRGKKEKL